MRRRVGRMRTKVARRAGVGLCLLVLTSACGGPNTDDPASVASSVMNAVAKSDCKTVHKLFPTAGDEAEYPAEGCTNEIDQSRAVGTYACTVDTKYDSTATDTSYNCTSSEDPSTYFSVSMQK